MSKTESWLYKYKPTTFEHYESFNLKLKNISQDINNINHMILYGNEGTGKTSYIRLLISKIYQIDDTDDFVLHLNASDDRGIKTVRHKLKNFAKRKISNKYKFKLIVLDEADAMTNEAQDALRRIIEKYSSNTKFIFICNYIDKIISPIKSRCNIIKFKKLTSSYIKQYLLGILDKEQINTDINRSYVDTIVKISPNDMRKSITYLETLTKIENMTEYDIFEMFGILTKEKLYTLLKDINDIMDINDNLYLFNTYTMNDIISVFLELVLEMEIEEHTKYDMIMLLSEIDNIRAKVVNYDSIITMILMKYIELVK